MRIKDHFYLVSGGMFGQLANVYMIKHQEGCLLIDAGCPDAVETIKNNLEYWGYKENEVTHVLLTHGHDDHAGTAAHFQSLGADIIVGKEDAYMLEKGNFGEESPFTEHVMPKCTPDIYLEGDTSLTIGGVNIQVYTVPGHTNGSVIYYVTLDEDRILFSGDMFNIDGERGHLAKIWWTGDMHYSPEKLAESFAKLWKLDLDPTIIAGGHGIIRMGKDTKDMIRLAYQEFILKNRYPTSFE